MCILCNVSFKLWPSLRQLRRVNFCSFYVKIDTISCCFLLLHFGERKGIRDILGFWMPRGGFRIPCSRFWILCQWNLDYGLQSLVGSVFLELYSRFQSPGFLITLENFTRIRIPQDSAIRIP